MYTISDTYLFRLLQCKYALRLEIRGMRHSQGSVYKLVQGEFGFHGTKQEVSTQLDEFIEQYTNATNNEKLSFVQCWAVSGQLTLVDWKFIHDIVGIENLDSTKLVDDKLHAVYSHLFLAKNGRRPHA